ncbi:MAG: carbohydrate-binding protein, partial [Saprospiraceae bacterium]|nr:carbohydrate-binding protein [Saprospiraceae bacterium]
DYLIEVPETRSYRIDYRTAALNAEGRIVLQLINGNGSATALHAVSFPVTGGWQSWTTTSKNVLLFAGTHHLRILIDEPQFNLNWFEFSFLTRTEAPGATPLLEIRPNPASNLIQLDGQLMEQGSVSVAVRDSQGKWAGHWNLTGGSRTLDIGSLPNGMYFLTITSPTRQQATLPFLKMSSR